MKQLTIQAIAALRGEWISGGRIVVGDDPHPADHAAIYDWVLNFIENGIDDPEYESIYSSICHSLNFDIPFIATKSVRDELLHTARMKIEDASWRCHPS